MKRNIGVINKFSNFRNKKGITLIALIVTIIVLLILAGVSIITISGENGLLERARVAIEKTEQAESDENTKISNYENAISEYIDGSRSSFIESDLVTSIDFEASKIYCDQINLNITVQSANENDAVVYYVFCNGKVVAGKDSNQIEIKNLDADTLYTFKCGVIDCNGNIRLSEEKQYRTSERIAIYENGILNSDLAGVWTSAGNGNQCISENEDSIYFYNTKTGSYSNKIFWLNNKIDFSNFNNLTIKWKVNSKSMCVFGATSNVPSFTNATNDTNGKTQFASSIVGTVSEDIVTQKVDISNIDSGYIAFYLLDTKAYIYSMYLE